MCTSKHREMSRDWKEQVSEHGEISGSHRGATEQVFWDVTPCKWHVRSSHRR